MPAPGRSDDGNLDAPAPADDTPTGIGASRGDDAHYDDAGDDGRAPWYSWERWKYIGGALFLILGLSSVGYVLWDIMDLLPKPVTVAAVRAARRESPGRITDMLALSGMISFGPPAGVDLMFGATQAAKNWARQERKKGIAIGNQRGVEQGREEERTAMQKRLSKFAGQGMTPEQLQQVIDELSDGGSQDRQK